MYPNQIAYAVTKSFINTWLDQFFYDVNALSAHEVEALPPLGEEPLLIRVPPGGTGPITSYHSVEQLKKGSPPRAYVLAGAVSASLGGASLARNVADALQEPVCVVLPGLLHSGWTEAWMGQDAGDRALLQAILDDEELEVDFLLGHSRGCLGLAQALEGSTLKRSPVVVTLGGVVEMPQEIENLRQLLGEFDWLGSANSRLELPHEILPGCGHHLNSDLPFAVNVGQALRERDSGLQP